MARDGVGDCGHWSAAQPGADGGNVRLSSIPFSSNGNVARQRRASPTFLQERCGKLAASLYKAPVASTSDSSPFPEGATTARSPGRISATRSSEIQFSADAVTSAARRSIVQFSPAMRGVDLEWPQGRPHRIGREWPGSPQGPPWKGLAYLEDPCHRSP